MNPVLREEYDRIRNGLIPAPDAGSPGGTATATTDLRIVLSDAVPVEFRQRKPATEFPLSLDVLDAHLRRHGHRQIDYAFLPSLPTQRAMRADDTLLPTLGVRGQPRYPVRDAQLWGVNMMNMLQTPALFSLMQLAGVPLLREQRDERFPLVVLGGHIWPNPRPLSPFYDAMVVGDGEEALHAIATLCAGVGPARERLLPAIAGLPGVYVPGHSSLPVGAACIDFPAPVYAAGSSYILNGAAALLLARGCPYHCAFCLSSHVGGRYRPKPFEQLAEHLRTLKAAGATRVILVAAAASYYEHQGHTAADLLRLGRELGLTMRLMSDRPERFADAEWLDAAREAGKLILAPEASPAIRATVFRKTLREETLQEAIDAAIAAGIRRIQLYVILAVPPIPAGLIEHLPDGFGGETLQDIRYIAELGMSVADRIVAATGPPAPDRACVTVDCMPFIAAPGTRLERADFSSYALYLERIAQLRAMVAPKYTTLVEFTAAMDPLTHRLQAFLERGDETAGLALLRAWEAAPDGELTHGVYCGY